MKELFEKTEDIKKADLSKKEISIIDISGNIIGKIAPIAIESCMNPGIFNIKPIEVQFDKNQIILKNEREIINLSQKDLEKGNIRLQVEEFIPKSIKTRSVCTKCTNCGRCSW